MTQDNQRFPYRQDGEQGYKPVDAMQKIAENMDMVAFQILLSLLNWGRLWEDLAQGKAGFEQNNDDYIMVMMAPFTGMGGNIAGWQVYGPVVIPIIMEECTMWCADPVYRKANPMAFKMLVRCAPALSAKSTTWENSHEVVRIIADNFKMEVELPTNEQIQERYKPTEQQSQNEPRGAQPGGIASIPNPGAGKQQGQSQAGIRMGSIVRR